ncbi:MAG: hypothetical protein ACOYNF_16975 [Rhodoferax sp.]
MSNLSANPFSLAQAHYGAGIREFLAFKLGKQEYGIAILRVPEIRSFERPTWPIRRGRCSGWSSCAV